MRQEPGVAFSVRDQLQDVSPSQSCDEDIKRALAQRGFQEVDTEQAALNEALLKSLLDDEATAGASDMDEPVRDNGD